MRIEDLSVVLRPRSGWEAVELGFALTRRHARVIWLSWLATTLPVFAVLNAVGWWLDLLWLPALLLWWLKPAFERAPLYVISRGVFGSQPSVRETLRGQFRFARSIWPWLLWLRLSPSRALLMPVDMLEGVEGPLRRARRQALARNASGTAALILLVCVHVEAILGLGLIGLVVTLTPIEFMQPAAQAVWENLFEAPPPWAQLLMNLIYWAGVSLMAPFYVGAGFALYLNRRTELEAWDLEQTFRRLVVRLRPLLLLLGLGTALVARPPAEPPAQEAPQASTPAQPAYPKDPARVLVEDLLAKDPDFARTRTELRREFRPSGKEARWLRDFLDALFGERKPQKREASERTWVSQGFVRTLASVLRVVLVVALVILALQVLRRVLAWRERRLPKGLEELPTENVVGLDIRPESLPLDVAGEALLAYAAGRPREALALLYRASLAALVHRHGVQIPASATEGECLRAARRVLADDAQDVFARLTSAWTHMAYLGTAPLAEAFEVLAADWRTAFGGRP